MTLDGAWARAQTASFKLQGVPITVRRPAPDDTAVATRGLWIAPLQDVQPIGRDFYRREPRKVLAIPRATTLPNVPKDSMIVAPERQGEIAKTWRVEGYADVTVPDEVRVIVVPATES